MAVVKIACAYAVEADRGREDILHLREVDMSGLPGVEKVG